MVTQESFLFNGTIRENLLMGKPDATDEELMASGGSGECARFHRSVAGRIEQRRGRARREIERG